MKTARLLFAAIAVSILYIPTLYAVRAYPYPIRITQPDGKQLAVKLVGDEFFHYKSTIDGFPLIRNARGFLTYAKMDAQGNFVSTGVTANDIEKRLPAEKIFLQTIDKSIQSNTISRTRQLTKSSARVKAEVLPQRAYPLTGTPKSLVILVNFSDTAFSVASPKTAFTNMLNQSGYSANGGTGSAKDYFRDNSMGVFNPNFDVVGPFTLPQKMSYYGKNDANNEDMNPAQMIVDACKLADTNGTDFTQYDTDNDGIVDNIFVYYAGYNEAEHGPDNSVWPHRWGVYPGTNYTGTTASITFDGKRIVDYACSSELRGSSGVNMCGIGTFCHEFGHVLGLPDLYPTNGESHHALGDWDVMDYGPYLNGGRTPCGYSSYERFFLNWLTPTELKTPQNISLDALSTSNKAYLISQSGNHNLNGMNPSPVEFFMLENRQKKGWDSYLPGHGLLITHIYYNASDWENNTPNNLSTAMGIDIKEADGISSDNTESGDTYPGTKIVQSFAPALRSGAFINKNLTNITETNDVISFAFMDKIPSISTSGTLQPFSTILGTPSEIQTLTVNAKSLSGNLLVTFSTKQHFEIKKEGDTYWLKSLAITPTNGTIDNLKLQIRYNPTVASFKNIHSENITFNSTGSTTSTISISGTSTRAIYITQPVALEVSDTTYTTFNASWKKISDATGYYLTAYSISEGTSSLTEGFDKGLNEIPGWKLQLASTATSTQFSASNIPALLFKNNNETVTTEKYLLPVSSLSFYIRSMNGSNAKLKIEATSDDLNWEMIDEIAVTTDLANDNKTYQFDTAKQYQRFRFSYTAGNGGLAFDDLKVQFNQNLDYIYHEQWIKASKADTIEYIVKNLNPATKYFYSVRASDKDTISGNYENITNPSNTVSLTTKRRVTMFQNQEKTLKAYRTYDGKIVVNTTSGDEDIEVYNSVGQLMIKTRKPEELEKIRLLRHQMYIVRVGDSSVKIVL